MSYYSIAEPVNSRQKIKHSEFLAFLFPIDSVEEAESIISQHRKEFPDATHHCFAYISGFNRETQFYSDSGEPTGTAGKPILNALLSANMTNILAIVTRYFGGIKLGTAGLAKAYSGSVQATLLKANKIPAIPYFTYHLELDYQGINPLKYKISSFNGHIIEENWDNRAELKVQIPEEKSKEWEEFINGLKPKFYLNYKKEE